MEFIFREFEKNDITYAHFKSNVNLNESFSGNADFDVLVERKKLHEAQSVLLKHGCKRFGTIPEKNYAGVDNWLAFDPDTGIIYHLHLHCQLATGKPLLKDYIIPWADIILKTRVYDEEWQIYKCDPNLEILLLTVRSVVKAHVSKAVKAKFGSFQPDKSLEREHKLLLQIADPDEVRRYCSLLFPKKYSDKMAEIALKEDWDSSDYAELIPIVRKVFADDRRFSPVWAFIASKTNILKSKCRTKSRKKLGLLNILKKTSEKSGLIIAFVGVDGAGKSTVTKEINDWLSPQIDCMRFYMGSGDGKVNPVTGLLKKVRKSGGTSGSRQHDGNQPIRQKQLSLIKNPVAYLKRTVGMYSTYCVEKDNNKKIRQMARYRMNGGICLLDRYPQTEVEGSNDGPKLCRYGDSLGNSPLYKHLLKKEKRLFAITRHVIPDIIFKIRISAETSMKRKPEQTDISVYENKIQLLDSITFNGANIVVIDGEQSYEDELLEIKRIIWEYL